MSQEKTELDIRFFDSSNGKWSGVAQGSNCQAWGQLHTKLRRPGEKNPGPRPYISRRRNLTSCQDSFLSAESGGTTRVRIAHPDGVPRGAYGETPILASRVQTGVLSSTPGNSRRQSCGHPKQRQGFR